jgi:hypothetical protein
MNNMIRVNGEVRQLLKIVVDRRGLDTNDGRRAQGILTSGSKWMNLSVLNHFVRVAQMSINS